MFYRKLPGGCYHFVASLCPFLEQDVVANSPPSLTHYLWYYYSVIVIDILCLDDIDIVFPVWMIC